MTLLTNIQRHMKYSLGKRWEERNHRDLFLALSLSVRDLLIEQMLTQEQRYQEVDAKRLYYLSIEFLIGQSLINNLHNLGLFESCQTMLREIGIELEELAEIESDAGLGNGGLGRLAACFLDSLAALGMPGFGYGLHYEYGLFKQEIDNGYQKEKPENWLADAKPLQIERADEACIIPLFGRIVHESDFFGDYNPMWMDWRVMVGVPYDIPIVGYGGKTVNYLRLYEARPSTEFDIQVFNEGDYLKAVEQKISSENISKILYPSDLFETGKELRLVQEYFLVACALRDILRRYWKNHADLQSFPDKVAIQMNDTHPALAVTELMRILVDENALAWEQAWDITRRTLAYTNHTLLPEALEKWPVDLLDHVLPRHLQIIYEINHRFLDEVAQLWPDNPQRLANMSLVEEGDGKQIRMAHLAIIGSHSVNGVSTLHTELLKKSIVKNFYEMWPERFNNKTNGVTLRRWLLLANPLLADLLSRTISEQWITNAAQLRELEPLATDTSFQEKFRQIKRANKERLSKIIQETTRIKVSPDSLFDVQAKRIHEYKRQLLNLMHIVYEYLGILEDGHTPAIPKTYIFAGKAAPGYWAAKQIIKLIHSVGEVINNDSRAQDLLKVVFIPDYRVSLAEKIIPAADLSEQISTAGKEASGTGNMKFALNGALTIGTLDGANIEILDEVGRDNIFIFGHTAEEINQMRALASYHPLEYYYNHSKISRVLDTFKGDFFCKSEPGLFDWIYNKVLNQGDEYFHLADFLSYLEAHDQAGQAYSNPSLWAGKAILNVARMGKFSSDRTIREYAREIWNIQPLG